MVWSFASITLMMAPVAGLTRPTKLAGHLRLVQSCAVNHRLPSGPAARPLSRTRSLPSREPAAPPCAESAIVRHTTHVVDSTVPCAEDGGEFFLSCLLQRLDSLLWWSIGLPAVRESAPALASCCLSACPISGCKGPTWRLTRLTTIFRRSFAGAPRLLRLGHHDHDGPLARQR